MFKRKSKQKSKSKASTGREPQQSKRKLQLKSRLNILKPSASKWGFKLMPVLFIIASWLERSFRRDAQGDVKIDWIEVRELFDAIFELSGVDLWPDDAPVFSADEVDTE